MTQVYSSNPNLKIAERIGEQKIILNNLALILDNYKEDAQFKKLLDLILPIKKVYDGVTIVETQLEPEKKVVDGMLKIIQHSKSTVEITDEQIHDITFLIEKVRNEISQGNIF